MPYKIHYHVLPPVHLFEDKDIYLTVTGNEEIGYAEELIVKPVKAGKSPLYAFMYFLSYGWKEI